MGGKEVTLQLTYESLPNFCYACGKLEHVIRECELVADGFVDMEDENALQYGSWLRAKSGRGENTEGNNVRTSSKDYEDGMKNVSDSLGSYTSQRFIQGNARLQYNKVSREQMGDSGDTTRKELVIGNSKDEMGIYRDSMRMGKECHYNMPRNEQETLSNIGEKNEQTDKADVTSLVGALNLTNVPIMFSAGAREEICGRNDKLGGKTIKSKERKSGDTTHKWTRLCRHKNCDVVDENGESSINNLRGREKKRGVMQTFEEGGDDCEGRKKSNIWLDDTLAYRDTPTT
ncbi:hypothetical protein LIER_12912 [Lithospermum erythrorhizon]|uniref:CCHC-type domain-containing protein n=1 Tax=Lithospermum erythrorhizon TaxID=34254 RepID=A0AAV3PVJ4_LITER